MSTALSVLQTRADGFGFELVIDAVDNLAKYAVFGALLQYPDTHGEVRDLRPFIEQLHTQQALACVAADVLSLVLLAPPAKAAVVSFWPLASWLTSRL